MIPAPGQVVPLASNHSLHYKYEWTSSNGVVGITSPVYYANKPGVYRCTVTTGDRLDQTCLSRSINVVEGIVVVVTLFFVRVKVLNVYAGDAMTGVTDEVHNQSTSSKCNPSTSIIDSVENSGHISTSRSMVSRNSHGHTTENQGNILILLL